MNILTQAQLCLQELSWLIREPVNALANALCVSITVYCQLTDTHLSL